jgi:hypothetical protein
MCIGDWRPCGQRFKKKVSPDNGSHVGFYKIESVICEGPLKSFKCVHIIVPEIFKNGFLNCFSEKATNSCLFYVRKAAIAVIKEFPKVARIYINGF